MEKQNIQVIGLQPLEARFDGTYNVIPAQIHAIGVVWFRITGHDLAALRLNYEAFAQRRRSLQDFAERRLRITVSVKISHVEQGDAHLARRMNQALRIADRIGVHHALDPATQRSATERNSRNGKVRVLDFIGLHYGSTRLDAVILVNIEPATGLGEPLQQNRPILGDGWSDPCPNPLIYLKSR